MKKILSILFMLTAFAFFAASCGEDNKDVQKDDQDLVTEEGNKSILGEGDAETQYNVTLQGKIVKLSDFLVPPDTSATAKRKPVAVPPSEDQVYVFESGGEAYLVFGADGAYIPVEQVKKHLNMDMTLKGDVKKSKGLNMIVTSSLGNPM